MTSPGPSTSMSQRSIAVSTTWRPYDRTSFRTHARSVEHAVEHERCVVVGAFDSNPRVASLRQVIDLTGLGDRLHSGFGDRLHWNTQYPFDARLRREKRVTVGSAREISTPKCAMKVSRRVSSSAVRLIRFRGRFERTLTIGSSKRGATSRARGSDIARCMIASIVGGELGVGRSHPLRCLPSHPHLHTGRLKANSYRRWHSLM